MIYNQYGLWRKAAGHRLGHLCQGPLVIVTHGLTIPTSTIIKQVNRAT